MTVRTRIEGLEALLKATDPAIVDRSLKRALRAALRAGRTELSRGVRARASLAARTVNRAISIRVGSGQGGALIITSPAVPLSEFKPRKTASGFSIALVRGQPRARIEGAFQFPSAGQRLFRRTGQEKAAPRKGRYAQSGLLREPITQLFTRSLPQIADDPAVIKGVEVRVEQTARAELLRQLQVFGAGA